MQISEQNSQLLVSAPADDFTLDLQGRQAGGLTRIESPAFANAPLESGSWEADRLSESLVSEAYSSSDITQAENASHSQMSKIEESLLELETKEPPDTKNVELHVDEPIKAKNPAVAEKPVAAAPPPVPPVKTESKPEPAAATAAPEAKVIPPTAKNYSFKPKSCHSCCKQQKQSNLH